MKYGYIRIKNINEKKPLDHLLSKYECEKIYTDLLNESVELERLINALKPNDKVVVKSLGHFSNEINKTHKIIKNIRNHGATLTIIDFDEHDEIKNPKFLGIIDDFISKTLNYVIEGQQKIQLENQRKGIEAAKKAGKYKGGRPKYTDDSPEVNALLKYAKDNPKLSMRKLCKLSGIKSRTTAYSILKRHGIDKKHYYELSIEFKKHDN